jgi:hypothetical protein
MVHKAVLREMQHELGAGFPVDASTDGALASAADVALRLRASLYWIDHEAALKRWIAPMKIEDRIQAWGQQLQADLAGDGAARRRRRGAVPAGSGRRRGGSGGSAR